MSAVMVVITMLFGIVASMVISIVNTHTEVFIFLKKRMKPSHIYQPVMIKTLIDCGGSATVRQIAQAFLLQDESQIQYYEERVKEMPIRVLKKARDCRARG